MRFIPPWDVEAAWGHYADVLAPAIARQTAFNADGLLAALKAGQMHLWDADQAVLVTQIQNFQLERVCVIILCAGYAMDEWSDDAWATVRRYAKHHGCEALQIYGRRGWLRARPEFREVETIMRAEL